MTAALIQFGAELAGHLTIALAVVLAPWLAGLAALSVALMARL